MVLPVEKGVCDLKMQLDTGSVGGNIEEKRTPSGHPIGILTRHRCYAGMATEFNNNELLFVCELATFGERGL